MGVGGGEWQRGYCSLGRDIDLRSLFQTKVKRSVLHFRQFLSLLKDDLQILRKKKHTSFQTNLANTNQIRIKKTLSLRAARGRVVMWIALEPG